MAYLFSREIAIVPLDQANKVSCVYIWNVPPQLFGDPVQIVDHDELVCNHKNPPKDKEPHIGTFETSIQVISF